MVHLKRLNLSFSRINSIYKSLFKNQNDLEELNLQHNNIDSIRLLQTNKLQSLKRLKISFNKINPDDAKDFICSRDLESLDFCDNAGCFDLNLIKSFCPLISAEESLTSQTEQSSTLISVLSEAVTTNTENSNEVL